MSSRSRSRSRGRSRERSPAARSRSRSPAPRKTRSTHDSDLYSIRVGNELPRDYTEEELKEKFSKWGEIGDIYMPRQGGRTGDTKGYGFVRFFERDDQEACFDDCEKSPLMIDGIECKVELASKRPPPKSSRRDRSRSRDRYSRRRSRSRSRDRRRRSRSRSYERRRRSRSRDDRRRRSRSRSYDRRRRSPSYDRRRR